MTRQEREIIRQIRLAIRPLRALLAILGPVDPYTLRASGYLEMAEVALRSDPQPEPDPEPERDPGEVS